MILNKITVLIRFRIQSLTTIKSIVTTVILIVMIISANYQIKPNSNITQCMLDNVQVLFSKATLYLEKNHHARNLLIFLSSLLIDLIVITTCTMWSVNGKSFKFIISVVCFYLFRMLVQKMYQMPYPDKYIFADPGFYSLTVSYLKTNDFFFSGHVGIPLLCAHEYKVNNLNSLMIFCIFASFLEAFVMISTGGHYSVDILAGWLFALYFIKIATFVAKNIDWIIFTDIDNKY